MAALLEIDAWVVLGVDVEDAVVVVVIAVVVVVLGDGEGAGGWGEGLQVSYMCRAEVNGSTPGCGILNTSYRPVFGFCVWLVCKVLAMSIHVVLQEHVVYTCT